MCAFEKHKYFFNILRWGNIPLYTFKYATIQVLFPSQKGYIHS